MTIFFLIGSSQKRTTLRQGANFMPALLDLHLLLLLAEVYAEHLHRVEEKICKYEPEFKERRKNMSTITLKLDQEKLDAELEKAKAARVKHQGISIEATVISVADGKVINCQKVKLPWGQ